MTHTAMSVSVLRIGIQTNNIQPVGVYSVLFLSCIFYLFLFLCASKQNAQNISTKYTCIVHCVTKSMWTPDLHLHMSFPNTVGSTRLCRMPLYSVASQFHLTEDHEYRNKNSSGLHKALTSSTPLG